MYRLTNIAQHISYAAFGREGGEGRGGEGWREGRREGASERARERGSEGARERVMLHV